MNRLWAAITPVLWFSLAAQDLPDLGRRALDPKSAAQAYAALASRTGGVEQLAAARAARLARSYPAALKSAALARTREPRLSDYADFEAAWAARELGDWRASQRFAESIVSRSVPSPLRPPAHVLRIEALLEQSQTDAAISAAQAARGQLSEARRQLLLATAYRMRGDLAAEARALLECRAATVSGKEADEAAARWSALVTGSGGQPPPPPADLLLRRAALLIPAGLAQTAAAELATELGRFRGVDRVRLEFAYAKALSRSGGAALPRLQAIQGLPPEEDAERLFELHALARKLKLLPAAVAAVEALDAYPASPWRLQALFSIANHYFLDQDWAKASSFYARCAEGFPNTDLGAQCHWKLAWRAYTQRSKDARTLLRTQWIRFAAFEKAAAAAYYLGRLAESERDPSTARAYYNWLRASAPNSYYELLARTRRISAQARVIDLPKAANTSPSFDFTQHESAKDRIARAALLRRIGWQADADAELRFGLSLEPNHHALAIDLIRSLYSRGEPGDALRAFKRYFAGYLRVPPSAAPDWFWKLGFPLPFQASIEQNCRANQVPIAIMAGLIRQESEFDPKALSRSRAHGLTQVMPATGRELARRSGIKRFSSAMLFQPEVNLKLGIKYFGQLLRSLDGSTEAALASYNGGKSRVDRWLAGGSYDSVEEFVESIPLSETRNYVQIVVRNADVYRRLYGLP
jgi:soluble lytic murein transglycosylase